MAQATGNNFTGALIGELNGLLADHLALYIKTKNFHWHVAGRRFRDLHLLFDEQATEIFAQVDVIAERVRKLGGNTVTSLANAHELTSISDQDNPALRADDMLEELRVDNSAMVAKLKQLKEIAGQAGDNATDGMIDDWTDLAERRVWFLTQTLK